MKQIKFNILTLFLLFSFVAANAQEKTIEPESTAQMAAQEMMEELAKASQNPVADMNSVPFQFNWFTGGGLGDQTMSQTLIQPVLPLPLSKNWNIVSRTIVPIVNAPAPYGERSKGIGDIQEQIFFSNTKKHKVITGFGPVFSFPTSTNEAWATGQFAVGPAVVALMVTKKWVFGGVANNLWRFAGSDVTAPISLFFVQPFINYNLKRAWAIGTAPSITANWSAASGQEWTVPLGLNVSKVTVVGKQPISINIQYYRNVVRPDAAGANQIRMSVSFLFPRRG
jgi:hypothetical protein